MKFAKKVSLVIRAILGAIMLCLLLIACMLIGGLIPGILMINLFIIEGNLIEKILGVESNKKIERYDKIIRINKIMFSGIIGIIVLMMTITSIKPPEQIKNMILENEQEYNLVATTYHADYKNRKIDIGVYSDGSDGIVYCYDENVTQEIIYSDESKRANQIVGDTYDLDDATWDRTYVYDKYVSFSNINGRESLVYSVDGSKPKYVNVPDDKVYNACAHRINKHWYCMHGKR